MVMLQIDRRRIEEAEDEARFARAQANDVNERLMSVRRRLEHMEVRAPVSGEVFGMTAFAPGEVVRPGDEILQIVPLVHVSLSPHASAPSMSTRFTRASGLGCASRRSRHGKLRSSMVTSCAFRRTP